MAQAVYNHIELLPGAPPVGHRPGCLGQACATNQPSRGLVLVAQEHCNLPSRWSGRLRAARSGAAQRRVSLHCNRGCRESRSATLMNYSRASMASGQVWFGPGHSQPHRVARRRPAGRSPSVVPRLGVCCQSTEPWLGVSGTRALQSNKPMERTPPRCALRRRSSAR